MDREKTQSPRSEPCRRCGRSRLVEYGSPPVYARSLSDRVPSAPRTSVTSLFRTMSDVPSPSVPRSRTSPSPHKDSAGGTRQATPDRMILPCNAEVAPSVHAEGGAGRSGGSEVTALKERLAEVERKLEEWIKKTGRVVEAEKQSEEEIKKTGGEGSHFDQNKAGDVVEFSFRCKCGKLHHLATKLD